MDPSAGSMPVVVAAPSSVQANERLLTSGATYPAPPVNGIVKVRSQLCRIKAFGGST